MGLQSLHVVSHIALQRVSWNCELTTALEFKAFIGGPQASDTLPHVELWKPITVHNYW